MFRSMPYDYMLFCIYNNKIPCDILKKKPDDYHRVSRIAEYRCLFFFSLY
jgi:hypothetical protein